MLGVQFTRAFRTPYSERFIVQRSATDIAACDIHYLLDGTVQSSLIVFEGCGLSQEEVPTLLTYIDEVLLPEVSLDDHRLFFTVSIGRVIGSFEAEVNPGNVPTQLTGERND